MRKTGKLLKEYRNIVELTQKELAKLLVVDHSHISNLERDKAIPSSEFIQHFIKCPQLQLTEVDKTEIEKVYQAEFGSQLSNAESQEFDQQTLNLNQTASNNLKNEYWISVPDVQLFQGKDDELEQLTNWIVTEQCRLVGVFGMGGQGKTLLAAQLGEVIKGAFEYAVWFSLLNAPPFTEFLQICLQIFDLQNGILTDEHVSRGFDRLITCLQQHRCLLIVDNVETILRAKDGGHYRKGYEPYGQFIKQIGEIKHQSCLLLTSREQPKEFDRLGQKPWMKTLTVRGLDIDEAQMIVSSHDLKGSTETWQQLLKTISGNPLILVIAADTIVTYYQGDINQALLDKAVFSGATEDILAKQFDDRSSPLGRGIMYWLAIEREPVSSQHIAKNLISPVPIRKLIDTLQALKRRSLVRQEGKGFTMPNVLIEYVTQRLVEKTARDIKETDLPHLNHYALIKATAKVYVREQQRRMILQPIAELLRLHYGDADRLITVLQQTLRHLRTEHDLPHGYAAGNILNLLTYLDIDLTGYDFSNLTIRQAYLQDTKLHKINISHTHLLDTEFKQYSTGIYSLAFSLDGSLLATGNMEGVICLWRITREGLTLKTSYKIHDGWVWSVNFSPDGNFIISSGDDGTTTCVWDIRNNTCLNKIVSFTAMYSSMPFEFEDRLVFASSSEDGWVRLWDAKTGKTPFKVLKGHTGSLWGSCAFNSKYNYLASGGNDSTARLWNISTGECLHVLGHPARVWTVAFSPDNQHLASAGDDMVVYLWDVKTGACLKKFIGHIHPIRDISFHPNGNIMATVGHEPFVYLWDVDTGKLINRLSGHRTWVRTISFSADGQFLASGGDDCTIRLWDTKTGQIIQTIEGYSNQVKVVRFFNPQTLITGSDDFLIRLWNTETGNFEALSGHTNFIWSIVISHDKRIVATAGEDQTVRLWNMETKDSFFTLSLANTWVRVITFSPDDSLLVMACEDYLVHLWHVETKEYIQKLSGHQGWVLAVTYSPDGQILASCSRDSTIKLWRQTTASYEFECWRTLTGHHNEVSTIAWHPNTKLLASGGDDQIVRLWEIDKKNEYTSLTSLSGHNQPILAVTFSPDGELLASCSTDGIIKLWQVSTGNCLHSWQEHHGKVLSMDFSPNGKFLASSGADGSIKLWRMSDYTIYKTLRPPRPYEGMNITGVTGLTEAQHTSLKALGAVVHEEKYDKLRK
ncbi:NB-ARC domain-containing protein [Anaerolineales bacterium HSG24]|nr:NB-ARC domain-containing protein [Anaerolineales bacterium HSG24]